MLHAVIGGGILSAFFAFEHTKQPDSLLGQNRAFGDDVIWKDSVFACCLKMHMFLLHRFGETAIMQSE